MGARILVAGTLRDLVSGEVSELPRDGATKTYRFAGAIVGDPNTGEEITIEGPVDLDVFRPIPFSGTRADGTTWSRDGISLLVIEEDLVPIARRRLNLVAMRLIELLHADLESGAYLRNRYEITGIGSPPKTRYNVVATPILEK